MPIRSSDVKRQGGICHAGFVFCFSWYFFDRTDGALCPSSYEFLKGFFHV